MLSVKYCILKFVILLLIKHHSCFPVLPSKQLYKLLIDFWTILRDVKLCYR